MTPTPSRLGRAAHRRRDGADEIALDKISSCSVLKNDVGDAVSRDGVAGRAADGVAGCAVDIDTSQSVAGRSGDDGEAGKGESDADQIALHDIASRR